MLTKIEAARLATASGVDVIIADGREQNIITRLALGEAIGTHFTPAASKLESRERWMLSGLCTRGCLVVDDGAVTALIQQNKSLLPAGVKEVQGEWERGDIVDVCTLGGARIATGITNYSSMDAKSLKGIHSGHITQHLGYDYGAEIIHRNNMVLIHRRSDATG
jgi:glutamate 5-kinase